MDLAKSHADLGACIPAQGGADQPGAEVVIASFWVPEHDGEVFGDVVEEDMKGMLLADILGGVQYPVFEGLLVFCQMEVLRVACTDVSEHHFHELLAGQFRPR